ncbi:MAG: tetratricopeptide repeat protein [Candidatus Rokubacteria bacterium]|nr:tetratricopeptide repeat protein [Candidatus Rokubacteria bacterium]
MSRKSLVSLVGSIILVGLAGAIHVAAAAEPRMDDAVKLFKAEKLVEAEKVLGAILAKSPDQMDARLLMGWSLWGQGRYDEALVRFKSVLREAPAQRRPTTDETISFNIPADVTAINNPDLASARKGLGWTYFKKGWIRLAGAQFTSLNTLSSKWDEPLLGLGFVYLAQGKFNESEAAFREYLAKTPSGTNKPHEGARGLGDLFVAKGEPAKAIPHLLTALKGKPGWLEVQSLLAWSYLQTGDSAKAAEIFSQLKTARPAEAEAGLAWVALKRDRLDEAEAGFGRALVALPGYGRALEGIRELRGKRYKAFDEAWALYYGGKNSEAVAAFERLRKEPGRLPDTMKPLVLNGLGWSRLALGDAEEAEKIFQESLRELPNGAEATAGLGFIGLRRKEWETAEKAFVQANGTIPGLAAANNGFAALRAARFGPHDQAWELFYLGKHEQAIKAFEALLTSPGDLPAATLPFIRGGIGWTQLALGKVDSAEEAFKQIRPASKMEGAEAKAGVGWIALRRNQLEPAQKLFTEALTGAPGYAAALRGFAELRRLRATELDVAWAAYNQGKFGEAVPMFKKVIETAGLPADYVREARRGQAWSLYYGGKLQEAAAEFEQLVKAGEDADVRYGQGLALAGLGQHGTAAPALGRAAALAPGSLDYQAAHGRALLASGDAKGALAAFTAAYRLAPASAEVNRMLGWTYVKLNRPAEAKAAFRYALTLIPGYSDDKPFRELTGSKDYRDLRGDLAWGYVRWQAFEPARKLFEELTKESAADGNAWFGHGYALYKLGKAPEAEASLNRALKAKRQAEHRTVWVVFPESGSYPVLTDVQSILGWVSLVAGKCEQAVERFDASLDRDPDLVSSMVGKAFCLGKKGERTAAREIYLTAQEVYPAYPPVLAGLRATEPKKTAEMR